MDNSGMFQPISGTVVLETTKLGSFQEVPLASLDGAVFAKRGTRSAIYLRLYRDGKTSSPKIHWRKLGPEAGPVSYNAFGHMLKA